MFNFDTQGLPEIRVPVLIVGGSMVGMTLAALLAKQGLPNCMTIEKHASTAVHPRAALFHPRSMQIYSELGLYEKMRNESLNHYDEKAGLYNVETLAGKQLNTYMTDINQGLKKVTPFSRLFLTQQMFEPLLRDCAISQGATLRFSTELLDFYQDSTHVTALISDIDTGQKQIIHAKYMIAADGSRSPIRNKLAIPMQSHGVLSHSLTIYFQADLHHLVSKKYNGVIYVFNDAIRGFFRLNKTGNEGFLVVNTYGPISEEPSRFPADAITLEKASDMLRAAIGDDSPFHITHLSPWIAACDVAETFSCDRILLVGDAASFNVPNGGYGGNTGIQASHNLAWKLVAVLKGFAGRDLVEKTYTHERQPIGKATVDQVFSRYVARSDPELPRSERWLAEVGKEGCIVEQQVPETWMELGYRYAGQAVGGDVDVEESGEVFENPETARARPGSLAHHVEIRITAAEKETVPISTLLGEGFVLVLGEDAVGWQSESRGMMERFEKMIRCVMLVDVAAFPANQKFYDRYGVSRQGCVLIRPDAVVAWSSHGLPSLDGELVAIMNGILYLAS